MPRKAREIPWIDLNDGVFYVHWYDAERRRACRKTLATRDPVEAQRKYIEFLAGNSVAKIASSRSKVGDILEAYRVEHIQKTVAAPVRYEIALRYLSAWFGDMQLHQIDIPQCRAYTRSRQMAGAHVATINLELRTLRAAFGHAAKWRRVTPEAIPRLEYPQLPRPEKVKWLTKDQVQQVIDRAYGQDVKDYILVAYYTAARKASVTGLTVSQVDLVNGRIDLHTAGRRVTSKRKPIVPIYPEIRGTMERLVAGAHGGKLFSRNDLYRPFVEAARRAGFEAHPHMLRHSRATHMLMDGEDPYKVAKLLGDTIDQVEKTYGHTSVEYLSTTSSLRRRPIEGANLGA